MPFANNAEGICISKGLCDSIKSLTEQRLAFDTKMGERARAYAAKHLSPDSESDMSTVGRVTYMKLRGDQLLHLAEMARHDGEVSIPEYESLAAQALEAYLAAQQEASAKRVIPATNTIDNGGTRSCSNDSSGNGGALPEIHPLRVELALRVSSVLLHLLDRPVEAWEVGYPTYLAAAEHPARLGARGLAITQALRDHLALINIEGEGGEQQLERSSANERAGTVRRSAKDGQAGRVEVEGEWGFLRLSTGCDESAGAAAGLGRTASDRLRVLAQVKHARACLEAVTATERVLLGTMESANIVQSALKQIFLVYTKKHTIPAQGCVDNNGHETAHRRKAAPHSPPRKGSFLSWSGFEAVCQDFNIVATASVKPSAATNAAVDRQCTQAHHNHRRQHHPRSAPPGHQRSPRASPASSASRAECRLESPTRMISVETTTSGLLSGVQACIAFLSSCTHGSVVASFPNDGKGTGGFSGDRAKRVPGRSSRGGSAAGDERKWGDEGGPAYWRGIERAVLSGSNSLEVGCGAPGLNFREFVDALARCGLVGLSSKSIGGTRYEKDPVSTAERVQAVFKTQMRLLDKQHVAAKLQQLVDLPPGVESRVEGTTKSNHGYAAGDGDGDQMVNAAARGYSKQGSRPGGGKNAAIVANPKSKTALAPVQTTTPRRKNR